ncbi:hypothetical protein D3C77_237950 [compost metagenome]
MASRDGTSMATTTVKKTSKIETSFGSYTFQSEAKVVADLSTPEGANLTRNLLSNDSSNLEVAIATAVMAGLGLLTWKSIKQSPKREERPYDQVIKTHDPWLKAKINPEVKVGSRLWIDLPDDLVALQKNWGVKGPDFERWLPNPYLGKTR